MSFSHWIFTFGYFSFNIFLIFDVLFPESNPAAPTKIPLIFPLIFMSVSMPSCRMFIASSIPTVFGLQPSRMIRFKILPLSENKTNSVFVPPPSIPIIIFSLSLFSPISVSMETSKISEITQRFSILGQDCPHSHLDTACGLIPNFSANSY